MAARERVLRIGGTSWRDDWATSHSAGATFGRKYEQALGSVLSRN
jgi:hypothetical protein